MSVPACIHNACVATQDAHTVIASAPGFWAGLWHGLIFPLAWIVSLFTNSVAVYAVPNDGGWYNFGFFLGIMALGGGAQKTHVIYRDRPCGPIVDSTARRVE